MYNRYPNRNLHITGVFWDKEDCKIPDGLSVADVSDNIEKALEYMIYHGKVSIKAYGSIEAFGHNTKDVTLTHVPAGVDRNSRRAEILFDSIFWAVYRKFANVMLILGGDISNEKAFTNALRQLKSRNYDILLAHHVNISGPLIDDGVVSLVWRWKSLLAGTRLKPIDQNFRTTTRVFWDIDKSQIPNGLNPRLIYNNIKSALLDKGHTKEVSIQAYTIRKEVQEDDFKSAGIPLVRGDEMSVARSLICADILAWARYNPGTNVFLIVGDIALDHDFAMAVFTVKGRKCNVLLSHPREFPIGHLYSSVGKVWVWRSLSAGGKPIEWREPSEDAH